MSEDLEAYRYYTEEDYLEDLDFRNWVLHPESYEGLDWEILFRSHPEQASIGRRASMMLLEMKNYFLPEELDTQTLDESFIHSLQKEVNPPTTPKVKPSTRRLFLNRLAVAATLIVCLGIAGWFSMTKTGEKMQVLATNYGEWKTHILPDGSEVKLNADSEIQFAKTWKQGVDRFVWLKGEAFFKVKKDGEGTKFTVITEDLQIKVLGTAFNVHSRGEETGVFLMEGKIELDLGKEEKEILPGEFISYSAPRKKITQYKKTDAAPYVSWKEGSLVMQDATVSEILAKIEEIYGLPVVVNQEELLEVQKTIAIPMDKIELTLPILSRTFGAEVQLRDGQLIMGP